METLRDFGERFHMSFKAAISEIQTDISRISSDIFVEDVYAHIGVLASGKAKRIRPYVASVMYKEARRTTSEDAVMPVLVALEMFHLFALIHDDIMDEADERYGVATIHAHVRRNDEAKLGTVAADHIGRSHAILAGDMLLTQVHALFIKLADLPDARKAHELLITMSREIVTGQHLDLAYSVRSDSTKKDILQRHHLKTSLYTFVRPMQIGSILGGGSEELRVFCEAFGTAIGQGFQLEDDLLDLLGNSAETGKKTCIDITQRQHTLLTEHVLTHGTPKEQAQLRSIWGKEIKGQLLMDTRQLFAATGAIDVVRSNALDAFTRAEELLNHAALQRDTTAAFHELLTLLRRRLP